MIPPELYCGYIVRGRNGVIAAQVKDPDGRKRFLIIDQEGNRVRAGKHLQGSWNILPPEEAEEYRELFSRFVRTPEPLSEEEQRQGRAS